MASLIGPLASGIVGAASGTAYIYERDEATAASDVYSDSDAQTAVTTHALDANGAVIRYVTRSVDVRVEDASGAEVRAFTWEVNAGTVEVTNDGFTGTMANGSTAAGGRVSLDDVLSLLYTSLGAEDGKVLVNGAGQYLKDVIGSSTGVFFNVKSSSYGATGDGTTDDKTAIQACVNAAIAAGGGIVYLPPGRYITSGAITISGKVTLLGVSADVCIIQSKNSSTGGAGILTITGADVTVQGVQIDNGTASTLFPFAISATGARFIGCVIEAWVTNTSSIAASCVVTFIDCRIAITQASTLLVANSGTLEMIGGSITVSGSATSLGLFTGGGNFILNGVFVNDSHTAGAVTMFTGTSSAVALTGCRFESTTGGTFTVFGSGPTTIAESGCAMPTFSAAFVFISAWPAVAYSTTRDSRATGTSGSATSYTPDASIARIHRVTSSGASFAFNNPGLSGYATGAELVLYYKNTSGGAITPTFGTKFKISTAPSVGNNQAACWTFIYESTDIWLQVGSVVAYAS